MVTLSPDGSGRIQEVVEYRQPTYEEMAAHLNRELPAPQRSAVDRLLLRGHAAPKRTDGAQGSNYYCELPSTREVDPMWRVRAVQAATEWVESWTPGPDLENMVREGAGGAAGRGVAGYAALHLRGQSSILTCRY